MTSQEIKNLIAKGKISDAITELANIAQNSDDNDFENAILQLSGQYRTNERNNTMGVLDTRDYLMVRAKVTNSLLTLCNELPNSGSKKTDSTRDITYKNEANVNGNGNTVIQNPQNSTINVGVPAEIKPLSSNAKTKILFIAANPTNESRLQTDKEHRIIKAEMERGSRRDAFEFLPPQFAVTITELLRAMNDKPNIIHFAGHGISEGIAITTDANTTQLVPTAALQRLFKPLKGITQIVLLNSCYSAAQAKVISQFGMYVIGNIVRVDDGAAISFAKGLYNGLGEGKSFEDAFNDAMIVVMTEIPNDTNRVTVWKNGDEMEL